MQRSERDDPNDKKKYSSNWVFVFGNWISSIMVDPRQILAGFLTVTMFVMLAHMIKRDHFSSHSQVGFLFYDFFFIGFINFILLTKIN